MIRRLTTVPDEVAGLVDGKSWILGATNYDEDFHFSTYYLRASIRGSSAGSRLGHTAVVAFYDGHREDYYLIAEECQTTSAHLVESIIQKPGWFPWVLRQIRQSSDRLESVFDEDLHSERNFSRYSDRQILALYRLHHQAQTELYHYARIPEALDRGADHFTNYLRAYLAEIGIADFDVDRDFLSFTGPSQRSRIGREYVEFAKLVELARRLLDRERLDIGSPAAVRLRLHPVLATRLRSHAHQWRYLGYHGYSSREPWSIHRFIGRLAKQLLDEPIRLSELPPEQDLEAQMLAAGLDESHLRLYRLYPHIAATKIYRRVSQLRAFYFLDMLMAEISIRIGIKEDETRRLTPEEIRRYLMLGHTIRSDHVSSPFACVLSDSGMVILSDEAYANVRSRVIRQLGGPNAKAMLRDGLAQGEPVSGGRFSGYVRRLRRASMLDRSESGYVLVCPAGDPDFIPLIERAGAVITEQGGVTAHASIVCREFRIPAVAGVTGAMDLLNDSMLVDVDGTTGLVRVLSSRGRRTPMIALTHTELMDPSVGLKARNLLRAQASGFPVPPFLVVSPAALVAAAHDLATFESIVDELNAHADGIILRSSYVSEDLPGSATAGRFSSVRVVDPAAFASTVEDFMTTNIGRSPSSSYTGSIIIQQFCLSDLAGVCLSRDPRQVGPPSLDDSVIIEWADSYDAVTSGRGIPRLVIANRITADVRPASGDNLVEHERRCMRAVVELCTALESEFGTNLDFEWGWTASGAHLFQIRPISRP